MTSELFNLNEYHSKLLTRKLSMLICKNSYRSFRNLMTSKINKAKSDYYKKIIDKKPSK